MNSATPTQKLEILVVDDSRLQALLLKNLLQDHGYAVTVAGNGEEAIAGVRVQRPDLVISDIVMPVMNGYEMCRAIKDDADLKDLPVVLLTTLSDEDDILLGLTASADLYLTKPYSPAYLLSSISALLQRADAPGADSDYLEMPIGGAMHVITAGRRQMLSLLLSTYGNAVEQNRALIEAQRELSTLNEQLREQARHIETQQADLQEANLQLQSLAAHDGLTGLKNHRFFKERLDEELQRAARGQSPLSLVLLDVDSFKAYNDAFGHPAGDEILKTVADVLLAHSRATDVVARYGGEEFAVLLPDTGGETSLLLAERLRAALESAPWPQRAITASFGIATFEQARHAAEDAALLLGAADRALYHSKKTGRNRVTHSGQMDETESTLDLRSNG